MSFGRAGKNTPARCRTAPSPHPRRPHLSTHTTSPTALQHALGALRDAAAATSAPANIAVAPAPISAGRFGIARTTGTPRATPFLERRRRGFPPRPTEPRRVALLHGNAPVAEWPCAVLRLDGDHDRLASLTALELSAVSAGRRNLRERAARCRVRNPPTRDLLGRSRGASRPPISARPMLPPPRIAILLLMERASVVAVARGPNIAVPMRTIVAPSSDRGFKIAAHSHRERVESRAVAVQLLDQSGAVFANQRRCRSGSLLRRWHAHQAAQLESAAAALIALASSAQLRRLDAALVTSRRRVDLQCRH